MNKRILILFIFSYGCMLISSCNLHPLVRDDRFVKQKKGYLLLMRRDLDTSYSDDVYLNRLANAKDKFSALFFESDVDTSKNKNDFYEFFLKQSSAVELGSLCDNQYNTLISMYSDTISIQKDQMLFMLPVSIRLINESRGIRLTDTIGIKASSNTKKKLCVESGKLTLISIDPIITYGMINRLK